MANTAHPKAGAAVSACTGKHKLASASVGCIRIELILSAFFFYKKLGTPQKLLPVQSICSMRPRLSGGGPVGARTARPYTHFVVFSIVFPGLFVNSKVGLRGCKLCVPLLTETEKWL